MVNFDKNLKDLRTKKGFSQEAFATKIGVHVTNLSKYERGISIPSLEIADKMAITLNVSLDELVYGKNKADSIISDNDLLNLFNQSQKLSEDQKKTIIELLEAFILKSDLKKQLNK